MSSPWQPSGASSRDEGDTGVRTGPFARAASSDASSVGGGGSASRPQGAAAAFGGSQHRGVESGGAPSSLGAIGEPVPFQGPFAHQHHHDASDNGSPSHHHGATSHRRRANGGPFDAAVGGPSSVTASFDETPGSPFGGLGSIGDSIGLSFTQTASHAIPIAGSGAATHGHGSNGHREDPYGSLPFADASSAPQHSSVVPPVSTGRVSASGGASAPASVNLAALTPDWILAATSPNTATSVMHEFPAPAGKMTPQNQAASDTTTATINDSPQAVAATAESSRSESTRASPGKFATSGSRGRASSGTAVLSPDVLAGGIDRALVEQLKSVDGSATCTLADAVARCQKARLAAGVPATGNVTFAADGSDRAVQVFVGQLPTGVTAEALGAVIDNLLGLHAVPKILHMRTPAAGSSQAAHALVTIEARHQRALLALNRRCYFTADAVFYVSSGKETAVFQRAIARTVAAVIAGAESSGGGSAKLSRACVVVEPANRSTGAGTPQGRGPSADGGAAMRHRKSPNSGRVTPSTSAGGGRTTPGGGANPARFHQQAPPSYAMQPSPTHHATAMAQAGGHHLQQPQHQNHQQHVVPPGYVVMGAPAPMHPATVGQAGSSSSSPTVLTATFGAQQPLPMGFGQPPPQGSFAMQHQHQLTSLHPAAPQHQHPQPQPHQLPNGFVGGYY